MFVLPLATRQSHEGEPNAHPATPALCAVHTLGHRPDEFGEPFSRDTAGPDDYWAYAAQLSCGLDVTSCAVTRTFTPPDVSNPPPSEDVPCAIGGTSAMSFVIPAVEMELGAGEPGGPGLCIADVVFFDPPSEHTIFRTDPNTLGFTQTQTVINGWSNACNDYHCGVLVNAAGEVNDSPCDVIAFCDVQTGLAHSVDFTW